MGAIDAYFPPIDVLDARSIFPSARALLLYSRQLANYKVARRKYRVILGCHGLLLDFRLLSCWGYVLWDKNYAKAWAI